MLVGVALAAVRAAAGQAVFLSTTAPPVIVLSSECKHVL